MGILRYPWNGLGKSMLYFEFWALIHVIFTKFHAIWAISTIFGHISTCCVSKYICSSCDSWWWYFHGLSHTPLHNFTQLSQISKSFRYHWLEKMKATDKIDFRARDLAFNISVHREKIQGKNNYIISYTHLKNH